MRNGMIIKIDEENNDEISTFVKGSDWQDENY